MAAATKVPYIGSKISLVSNAEIRYEGTLYTINTQDSTIALQSVRCFGTEGRKFPEIPPSSEVYDYIIFRGQDIKDLTVLEACNATSDPAIVSINERPRGGKGCGAQGATGKGAAATGKGAGAGAGGALGGFSAWGQQSQGAARGAQDRSAGYGGGGGAWGAGSGTGGKGGWSGGSGGAWGGAGLAGRSGTGWGAGGGGYKGKDGGGGCGKGGKSGLSSGKGKGDSGKAGFGGGKDKGSGKGKDRGCGGKDKGGGKASSKGGKGDFGKGSGGKGGKGGGRDSGGKGGGGKSGGRKSGGGGGDRGGGGGGGGAGQTVGELPPEENAEVKKEFAQEFDVSASNDKFDKVQTIDGTGFEDKLKPLEGYNKNTSFFDSISCEATERAAESDRPKVDRDKAREVDKETFGDTRRPPRPTSGRSGKGRRRGGGGGKGYRS